MGRRTGLKLIRLRHWIQAGFFALTNSWLPGWFSGRIYQGTLKTVCLPGLNCYSCPGSLGACPIGAMQAVLNNRNYKVAYYVVGTLLLTGAFLGRLVCGWLCPFGLVQDLIHKIPVRRKRKTLPGDAVLRYLKYAILVVFVIVLPLFATGQYGVGSPWFCKLICPSGTLLAGWPLTLMNASLRETLGGLFLWKNAVLIALLVLSVFVFRPFCRYLCPLGAVYGLMNPVALYRFSCDAERCTRCGACHKACPGDIKVYEKPNSPECIRCGKCIEACPHAALGTANGCNRNRKSAQ